MNQSLGIDHVDDMDEGRYSCEVENKGGRVSEYFYLEVLIPPQMETTEPQSITKREGDTLTLVCPVKSEFIDNEDDTMNENEEEIGIRIQWSKDGRPLGSDNSQDDYNFGKANFEITGGDGRRFILRNTTVSDAGQYKCVALNRAGQSHVKFHVEILCRHMASEFCRQLEHRHMIKYRRDYEHRMEHQEQRAGLLIKPPYFTHEENFEEDFNHFRIDNSQDFLGSDNQRRKTKQQKFTNQNIPMNFLSEEKIMEDYQKIRQSFNQNYEDFSSNNYLEKIEDIYQIIPTTHFLDPQMDKNVDQKKEKDFRRVYRHQFPKQIQSFKTNILTTKKPTLIKNFYYEGKLEFGDENYKIQKVYYQNHSVQLESAFSESLSNINSASPSVVLPMNRRRTHLQFYDSYQPFNRFRQYGLKAYAFGNLKLSQLKKELEKQKYLQIKLMEKDKQLQKVRIENQKLNKIKDKRLIEQTNIEAELQKQNELNLQQLKNILMQIQQLKSIEQKPLQERQVETQAEHFRLWNLRDTTIEPESSRFNSGVTINPLFTQYFTIKNYSQHTGALQIKNLRAKVKSYKHRMRNYKNSLKLDSR